MILFVFRGSGGPADPPYPGSGYFELLFLGTPCWGFENKTDTKKGSGKQTITRVTRWVKFSGGKRLTTDDHGHLIK